MQLWILEQKKTDFNHDKYLLRTYYIQIPMRNCTKTKLCAPGGSKSCWKWQTYRILKWKNNGWLHLPSSPLPTLSFKKLNPGRATATATESINPPTVRRLWTTGPQSWVHTGITWGSYQKTQRLALSSRECDFIVCSPGTGGFLKLSREF